jgi:UrcA family protein
MNTIITTAARALTICIAATLAFSAASASAGSLGNDESVTGASHKYVVRFPDLDLSRIEGVTKLYLRLRYGASVVCKSLESEWFPAEHRACVDKAIANAVATVNRPLLSQYHQLRTKGDRAGLVQLAKAP